MELLPSGRIGKFEVSRELVAQNNEHLQRLLDSMDIVKTSPTCPDLHGDGSGDRMTYYALFDEFDEVGLADIEKDGVPMYAFYFHRDANGNVTRERARRLVN